MTVRRSVSFLLCAVFSLSTVACAPEAPDQLANPPESTRATDPAESGQGLAPSYPEAQKAWRAARAERLRQPGSWLSLVGLHWLDEGESTFGSASDNDVVFPASTPARAGTIVRQGELVRMRLDDTAGWLVGSESAAEVAADPDGSINLRADADGDPTLVETGTTSFLVIRRDEKVGLRIRDSESPGLTGFTGLDWYPIDPELRIEARLEPHSDTGKPKILKVPNVLGQTLDSPSPGALVFSVEGKTVRLDPILYEGTNQFFVIFGDATNGETTYGAGRFLYADLPDDSGTVILDFNQAYNPPCAYTDFATCPLPPRQNRLKIAIEAGEKDYPGGHD